MPIREDIWPAGTPCWVDIAVPDVAAATLFYGTVLGWSFVDTGADFAHYTVALAFGRAAAAIGPVPQQGQRPAWTVYLASDDADATAKLITENGGTLLVEPTDIASNGRMCVALDASGCAFGVWQATETIGMQIADEPGSLIWTDARLTDPEAGRAFYSAVFGYAYQQVPGAPEGYARFAVEGGRGGGIGGMMGGAADPHWLAYFAVDDTDATVADAEEAGGVVVMRPQDTPSGRTAILADPFGATFGVLGPTVTAA